MVEGTFEDGDKPMIGVTLFSTENRAVFTPYFVLDTGFTGELALTPKIAHELGLKEDGVVNMRTAENRIVSLSSATVLATMERSTLLVTVLIKEGLPLLGIGFMEKFGYPAVVNCKNKHVELTHSN